MKQVATLQNLEMMRCSCSMIRSHRRGTCLTKQLWPVEPLRCCCVDRLSHKNMFNNSFSSATFFFLHTSFLKIIIFFSLCKHLHRKTNFQWKRKQDYQKEKRAIRPKCIHRQQQQRISQDKTKRQQHCVYRRERNEM